MTPSPQEPKTRRLRLTKSLIVALLLIFLALAVPWTPPGVRGMLERSLGRRLGCDVKIGRLTLWPLAGRVWLRDVRLDYATTAGRFRFAQLDRPLWHGAEVEIAFRFSHLFRRKHPRRLEIGVRNAGPLVVHAAKDALDLFPPFHDLLEQRSRAGKPNRWQVALLSLTGGDVRIVCPAPGDGESQQYVVSGLQIRYGENCEDARHQLLLAGRLEGEGAPPFTARVLGRGDAWAFGLGTGAFHLGSRGAASPSPVATVDRLSLQGQLRRRGESAWDVRLSAKCPRLAALGVIEKDTSATLVARFDTQTSQGAVALTLASRESRLDIASDVDLGGRRDSHTTVTIHQAAAGWLRLWNEWSPPQYPTFEGREGRLSVSGAARFLGHAPWFAQPRGRIELSGVHLISDYLPLTLRDVAVDGWFAPGRVEIRQCGGRWGDGQVSLYGFHDGPWWRRWEGTTRLHWAFALRAEDLLTTLPAAARDTMTTAALAALTRRPLLEGDLTGSGTLVLGWARDDPPNAPTTKSLQGLVCLNDGRIVHPILPAPVADIDGSFQVSPQRLAIESVSARLLGSTATVSATLTGEPFFWSTPTLRCRIRTEIPVAEAVRFLPDNIRPAIEAARPAGTLGTSFTLAGPMHRRIRPDDIAATGTAFLRAIAFDSPFWALAGRFHDVQARVDLVGRTVRLTTATGRIEDVPFQLQAAADPQAGRFWARLEGVAQMTSLREVIPRALGRYTVGGAASGRFDLTASGPDLFRQATRLRGLTSETLANLPFEWDLQGDVYARDVQLTFDTFPTSLSAINGRVHLDKFNWTFDNLSSSWGKTEECRMNGGGRLRPGSWPSMHIELEAPVLYLDEWIRPWRRPSARRFTPRAANPVFEMTGVVRGKRAVYRGHPGADFYGEMDLVSPRRGVDVFRFHNTHVDLYDGRLSGQGRVDIHRGRTTNTLELVADKISLPPFLQCESGREQTFVGRLTGKGAFYWGYGTGKPLTGSGTILITESKFWGNVFFRNLGQLIKIPLLDNVSFATIRAPFGLADRKVTCERLAMDGPLISLNGHGAVGFDHSVDFVLELGFPRLPDYAWLLDLVMRAFGKVPATVFSLDLTGTWDDPQFSFHQLGVAEKGLLDALEKVWNTVTPIPPTPPKPSPKPQP